MMHVGTEIDESLTWPFDTPCFSGSQTRVRTPTCKLTVFKARQLQFFSRERSKVKEVVKQLADKASVDIEADTLKSDEVIKEIFSAIKVGAVSPSLIERRTGTIALQRRKSAR